MTSSLPRARPFPWPALGCALAGAAVFQLFGNATRGYIDTASLFYWWGFQWVNPTSETEHGWLILALSGWLLWRNLRKVESQELRVESRDSAVGSLNAQLSALNSPWPPATAMALGLALHALGFAAQQTRVSIVALLVFTWGVLRFGGGRRWGGAAAFPLGFLVFAIPLNVLDSAGFWLRMWVIDASAGLAHAAGIGVLQNGTQLLAPDGRYQYDVAAACSGVRSLMALAALSLLVGYLNFRAWWRRGALLLLCFPLVYLGNVARIASVVFAAQGGGQRWGERAHAVMGYGVFAIVLGGILAAAGALRRWWPEPPDGETRESGCHPLIDKAQGAEAGTEKPVCQLMDDKGSRWVAVAVAGLAVGEMFFLHRLATLPPRGLAGVVLTADGKNPAELPAFLGRDWVGWPAAVTAVERDILPPDTGYARMDYVSSRDARHVFLSVVLSGRDRTSIHRPELCLVGQGWTITGAAERRFRQPRPGDADASFPATILRVRRESVSAHGGAAVPQLVAYWFVGGDTVVATHWRRLALDAWNRVVHARADRWAYVLMQTDAADGEAATLARMQAILNATLPAFQRPLPAG